MNLYVGNLSVDVAIPDLEQLFNQIGSVRSAVVIRDKFSGESRGFGFVEMATDQEGLDAIEKLNGYELKGQNIVVNKARPRVERRDSSRRRGHGGGGFRRY